MKAERMVGDVGVYTRARHSYDPKCHLLARARPALIDAHLYVYFPFLPCLFLRFLSPTSSRVKRLCAPVSRREGEER